MMAMMKLMAMGARKVVGQQANCVHPFGAIRRLQPATPRASLAHPLAYEGSLARRRHHLPGLSLSRCISRWALLSESFVRVHWSQRARR